VLTVGVGAECELGLQKRRGRRLVRIPTTPARPANKSHRLFCVERRTHSLLYLFVFPSSSLQPFLLFSGISSRAISVTVAPSLHPSLSVFASYSASLLWARGSPQPNLHPRRVRRSWQLFSAAPFAIMTTASNAACSFFLLLSKTPIFGFSGFSVCVVHENMKL